jgi:hypothetical protein
LDHHPRSFPEALQSIQRFIDRVRLERDCSGDDISQSQLTRASPFQQSWQFARQVIRYPNDFGFAIY